MLKQKDERLVWFNAVESDSTRLKQTLGRAFRDGYSVVERSMSSGLDLRMESGSREENASEHKGRVFRRFHEAVTDQRPRGHLHHSPSPGGNICKPSRN